MSNLTMQSNRRVQERERGASVGAFTRVSMGYILALTQDENPYKSYSEYHLYGIKYLGIEAVGDYIQKIPFEEFLDGISPADSTSRPAAEEVSEAELWLELALNPSGPRAVDLPEMPVTFVEAGKGEACGQAGKESEAGAHTHPQRKGGGGSGGGVSRPYGVFCLDLIRGMHPCLSSKPKAGGKKKCAAVTAH